MLIFSVEMMRNNKAGVYKNLSKNLSDDHKLTVQRRLLPFRPFSIILPGAPSCAAVEMLFESRLRARTRTDLCFVIHCQPKGQGVKSPVTTGHLCRDFQVDPSFTCRWSCGGAELLHHHTAKRVLGVGPENRTAIGRSVAHVDVRKQEGSTG